ncbi:MAG TPA: carboxypeptidase regulatory-like domain-containing protein, partial [Gemmatimonadaceae bacterium]|nr:carboxypeptidase regulatory-like domain-containing protein [Gemmatimonadaceae bacterium]
MTPTLVRRGAMLFALAFATPFLLSAQAATGTVSGRITDASIGRGLPDVQVLITGTRIGAVTGPNGEYTLVGVPTGSRSITVRRIGYQATTRAVQVLPGATATADVALNVSAVNLTEV